MRWRARFLFVLAALSFVSAVSVVIRGNLPEDAEDTVGYVVGLFLPPIVFLVGALTVQSKTTKT